MGKKSAISTEKHTQIVSLTTMELSEREISRQMKVARLLYTKSSKNFKTKVLLRTAKDQVVQGFPASKDDHVIRKVVSQSPMSFAKKIQVGMAERYQNK